MSRRALSVLTVIAAIAAIAVAAAASTIAARGSHGPVAALPPTHRSSSPPPRTAREFFLAELRDKLNGNWGATWRTLYPAHRLIASQPEFVSCERARPFPAHLRSLHVVRVRTALVRVPGRIRLIPGVALDTHVELNWYGPRDPITFNYTFHLVPVNGHWTWLLSPSRYRLYARNACLRQLAL